MKKLISSIAVLAICSSIAYAQEMTAETVATSSDKMMRKEQREMKMKDMSPQRKARMEERRKKFEALSPEKKKEMKSEMKRHRENMEKITGEKMPMHPHHEGHDMMEGEMGDK